MGNSRETSSRIDAGRYGTRTEGDDGVSQRGRGRLAELPCKANDDMRELWVGSAT